MSERSGRARERFAVLLLAQEPAAESPAPPNIGLPAVWVPSPVTRGWILRYAAAEPGARLPQAKEVRAALREWAAGLGLGPVRIKVLERLDESEILRVVRVWDQRRGAVGSVVTLSYPLRLPAQATLADAAPVSLPERLGVLFSHVLPWLNQRLAALHEEQVLAAAPSWKKPVWKHGSLGAAPEWAPSRVGRCALESLGRIVASQAERRQAFLALQEAFTEGMATDLDAGRYYSAVLAAEVAWDAEARPYLSRALVLGVAEQWAKDHLRRVSPERTAWDAFCGAPPMVPWAKTYTELQRPPQIERPFLTFAADDGGQKGQAVRYGLSSDGSALSVQLYLPEDATCKVWSWCLFTLALPEVVGKELALGGTMHAPDLRQTRAGRWVLDVKVEAMPKGTARGGAGRVLAFDWGLRKLLSAVVMEEGHQLSRPFFLQVGAVYAKLKELRAHASLLRRKVDRLKERRLLQPGLSAAEREALALAEAKAQAELDAVWRRYAKLQAELAHLGANFLLRLAHDSGCRVIVGEWLGSLQSRGRSADLNWRINSQIRSAILEKLRYKARRVGIQVDTVWPRGTSHRCPRCGAVDQRIKDYPPNTLRASKPGHRPRTASWFVCASCSFNGDRDYVAALNVGIEYFAELEARRAAEASKNPPPKVPQNSQDPKDSKAGQPEAHDGSPMTARETRVVGRRLGEAAVAHRQAVSYMGAAAARPFPSQKIGHLRRAGCLPGWRNRQVRTRPWPDLVRLIG